MTGTNQEPRTATSPQCLLGLKTIMTLTDAAQALFSTLYDLERASRKEAKARLARELREFDAFARTANHEDYRPGGDTA